MALAVKTSEATLGRIISGLMIRMGVPAHLRGFHYMKDGVLMTIDDMEAASRPTKILYPILGKRYHTTPEKVERALRNAIEVSWQRGDVDLFQEIFGFSISDGVLRPTNSEFISNVADYVRQ